VQTHSEEIMMKSLYSLIAVACLALALGGCGQEEEGPAERAGEQIDEAVEETQETMERTTEEVGEAMEEAGDTAREKTQ
jgi:hypothetical protein